MNKKEIINVSEINSFLFCPRKLFISKILNIKTKPTKKLIMGKLKHNILEDFSKNEKEFVLNLKKNYEKIDILFLYEDLIKKVSERIFFDNLNLIRAFNIDKDEFLKKLTKELSEEFKIRILELKDKLDKGFLGEDLWKSLESVYLAEIRLESEFFGLRGRVDKIQISRRNSQIIPYEIKSREQAIFDSDRLQLTAYALLLEDYYKTRINSGFIQLGARKEELQITEENKNKVLEILDEIRNLRNSLPPPILSNFKKCSSCDMKEDCMRI